MNSPVFYTAFMGTILSMTLLSYLAWKEHNPDSPRTLSQLAAQNKRLVWWFRIALWTCGTLFAITMYGLIIPTSKNHTALFIAWTVYYTCELLLALFPARGTIEKYLHNVFSYSMGGAMLVVAFLFAADFSGIPQFIEASITLTMVLLGCLTYIDKKRFIFYELPFIYLSHISILVAAIALH